MTQWHLNIWKVKIWLPQERKELSKWNKKHFFLFQKFSLLDIQNKLAKMYRTQPLTSWIVPNLFKWSLLRFKIPKPAFPLSIYFIFFLVFFSRQKLIYLLHFNIKIITSTNNSRNQDISFNSVRYLFCQLHYVLCNFLRRNRVFF